MKSQNKKIIIRFIALIFAIVLIAGSTGAFLLWRAVYKNNTTLTKNTTAYLFIKTGTDYNDLIQNIRKNNLLKNYKTFNWLSIRKNLPNHLYPGRYEIKAGMNNDELINMLRSGAQKPLNVTFNNIRTIGQLAGVIGKQIEADSASLIDFITGKKFSTKYNLDQKMAGVLFIPDTYEFFWNTSAEGFVERMNKEYNRFWDNQNLEKAKNLKLSPSEISILASIVDKETNQNDEKATIAGVYLNRIRKGWKLQADPTTVFAFYLENDSLLHRVYKKHTKMDSPYNTYVIKGLPPGPICLPSVSSIKAVLNAEKHDYMFFVAKADGGGHHHFSKTYNQHLKYAREHYNALQNRNN